MKLDWSSGQERWVVGTMALVVMISGFYIWQNVKPPYDGEVKCKIDSKIPSRHLQSFNAADLKIVAVESIEAFQRQLPREAVVFSAIIDHGSDFVVKRYFAYWANRQVVLVFDDKIPCPHEGLYSLVKEYTDTELVCVFKRQSDPV